MHNVLIVDDSALMRKVLTKIFCEHTNLNVVGEAKNGLEAYEMYKRLQPDLVTMDMVMPEKNGIESLQMIINEFPKAKIVMVSAMNKKNMIISAIKYGAINFILKPINTTKIIDVVKDVLGADAVNINKRAKKTMAVKAAKLNSNQIIIQLPEEKNTYENYTSWIESVKDEMHRELVTLWVEKVAAGTMTIKNFNEKAARIG